MEQSRVPAGSPAGGQFAAGQGKEAADLPALPIKGVRVGELVATEYGAARVLAISEAAEGAYSPGTTQLVVSPDGYASPRTITIGPYGSMPKVLREFRVDAFEDAPLRTLAPTQDGSVGYGVEGWNGFAVPRPTANELADWVNRVNATANKPMLAIGFTQHDTAVGEEPGWDVQLDFVCPDGDACEGIHDEHGCHDDESYIVAVRSLDEPFALHAGIMFEEQ